MIEFFVDDSIVGAAGEPGKSAQMKYDMSDAVEVPTELTASILNPYVDPEVSPEKVY